MDLEHFNNVKENRKGITRTRRCYQYYIEI